jgi:hypothetical protein
MIIFGHRKENWTPAPGLRHTGAGSAGETNDSRGRKAVFPADAGIQRSLITYKVDWAPAFAGVTKCENWTPACAGETAKTKVHK